MSTLVTEIRILFNGEYIMSTQVPWYYLPWWILHAVPLVTLTGGVLFILHGVFQKPGKRLLYSLVLFTFIFPVFYIIYQGSALHDGMRHILFVIPVLAIMAAIGWNHTMQCLATKRLAWLPAIVLIALLALPALWMVANHPHQAVYFNEITGGLRGAVGKVETDYWFNSVKPATQKLIRLENLTAIRDSITVVSNASDQVGHYMAIAGVPARIVYAKYNLEDDWVPSSRSADNSNVRFRNWDYAVFVSRYMELDEFNGHWPPAQIWFSEDAAGVPLTIVFKRLSILDTDAYNAYQRHDWQMAAALFRDYHRVSLGTGTTWFYSGISELYAGHADSAILQLGRSLQVRPLGIQPEIFPRMAQAYIQAGQPQQAIGFVNQALTSLNYRVQVYESQFRENPIGRKEFFSYTVLLGTMAELYHNLAVASDEMGMTKEANNAMQYQSQYANAYQQALRQLQ